MLKNPETGKRVSRANPQDQWQSAKAEHLRIVDDQLWSRVQSVNEGQARTKPHMVRRNRHLLSGLLRCGTCGSGMSVHDRDKTGKTRIRCSAVRESGVCTNRRILYLPHVEDAVVAGMRHQLNEPRLIEIYVGRYNEQRQLLASTIRRDRAKLERQIEELQREYDRVFTAYRKGFITEADAEQQLPALRADRDKVTAELAAADAEPQVIAVNPALVAGYLREVEDLAVTLSGHAINEDEPSQRLVQGFRSLIESVAVHPFPAREGFEVEVKGRLAELIEQAVLPASNRIGNSGGRVVAEVRFTPSPHIQRPLFFLGSAEETA